MSPLASSLAAIEWSRPWGFAALALPLLLILFDRTRSRPSELPTGTLAIWREVQSERVERSSRARRALPLERIVLAAALALGALALAGPRPVRPRPPRHIRVVLDRSPSMVLPFGDDTRLERAMAELEPLLEELLEKGDRLEWVDSAPEEDFVHEGPRPPASWLEAPWPPRAAPVWERFDLPGTIWLTDAVPKSSPEQAGFAASGGDAVPGPVGRAGEALWVFDGEQLSVDAALDPPPARARIEGRLPPELLQLFDLWCEERGLERSVERDPEPELTLAGPPAGERIDERAGRDGWSMEMRAQPGGMPAGAGRAWLSAPAGVLVAAKAGRIALSFDEILALEGDPEAFASTWSTLFDARRLPPRVCVPLDERAAVQGPGRRPPASAPRTGGGGARTPIDAWLGLAAAALALLALSLRGRSGSR